MNAVEIVLEGALYHCYPTRRDASEDKAKYIVAGVGSLTLMRTTGEIVTVAPVFTNGHRKLEALAPLIHAAA